MELAAEIKKYNLAKRIVLIHAHDRLLSAEKLPEAFSSAALQLLNKANVEVFLSRRVDAHHNVTELPDGTYLINLGYGQSIVASIIINAVSRSAPNAAFLPSQVVGKDGYVSVLPT